MTTNAATNRATQTAGQLAFVIDFDKKKLTKLALDCEREHQRLQKWLSDPIICSHFKSSWNQIATQAVYDLTWGDSTEHETVRKNSIAQALTKTPYFEAITLTETMHRGMRKNNVPAPLLMGAGIAPVPADAIVASLDAFMGWREELSSQSISQLYRGLLTVYYLTFIQPMGAVQTALNFVLLSQVLQKMGFGVVGDHILKFYAQHKEVVSETLSMCHHARNKRYHQQPWFQLFFEAWTWAIETLEHDIQAYCLQSCFEAHALKLLGNKTINERQYQLIKQLQDETVIRDKKSMSFALWYRILYKGLTRRTQERDFQLMCELGFIKMRGKQEFEM